MITFDEKLEAAWGLHKIEKAVLEKEIAELRAENETLRRDLKTAIMGDSAELQDVKRENDKLQREAAIRLDQIEREQEAHLKTMADLNKQAEMNARLLTENASLRADKENFWSQRNQYKREYEEVVTFANRIRDELTDEIFMLRDKLKAALQALEAKK